jgi:CDP-diacylglycerol--serine O-phosphatidyltransferase
MIDPTGLRWFAWGVTAFAGLTMVSNLKYYSFKAINLRKSVPFLAIFGFVLVLAFLSYQPATVLFGAFVVYALSGFAVSAWTMRKHRSRQP